MNSFWPQWLARPLWLRIGLQSALVGVLAALAGWSPLAGEWRGRDSLRQQVGQVQTQLELYRGKLARLPSAGALSAQWRELSGQAGAVAAATSEHSLVMAALRQSETRLLAWREVKNDSEQSQTLRRWQLVLGADYHQLLRFLRAFNRSPHPLRIARLEIARGQDGLTLTLLLSSAQVADER